MESLEFFKNQFPEDFKLLEDLQNTAFFSLKSTCQFAELYHVSKNNTPLNNSTPELLEALQELHNLLEEHQPNWYLAKHHNIARLAIKKATEV